MRTASRQSTPSSSSVVGAFAALGLALVAATAASADEPRRERPRIDYKVVARSGLNVRKGPGLDQEKISAIPLGTVVRAVKKDPTGWWRIRAERGERGWVHSAYLRPTTESYTRRAKAWRKWKAAVAAATKPPESGATPAPSPAPTSPSPAPTSPSPAPTSPSPAPTSPSPAPPNQATVIYNKTVSDSATRDALQRIATHLGKTIVVHSGDRSYVPPGGSRTSLHLHSRAADLHVQGMDDGAAFNAIMAAHSALLGGGSFEVIWHKPGTNTGGPHLHLGNYADGRGTYYKTEVGGNYVVAAQR